MVFERRQHTAEIREDDVSPLGKRHAVRKILEKLDLIRAVIRGGYLTSHLNDFTRLDGIDSPRTNLTREYRENSGSRANLYDDRTFLDSLAQSLSVSVPSNLVRDHRSIAAQVIHKI